MRGAYPLGTPIRDTPMHTSHHRHNQPNCIMLMTSHNRGAQLKRICTHRDYFCWQQF